MNIFINLKFFFIFVAWTHEEISRRCHALIGSSGVPGALLGTTGTSVALSPCWLAAHSPVEADV